MNGELDRERGEVVTAIRKVASDRNFNLEPLTFEHQAVPPSVDAKEASLEWVKQSHVFVGLYFKTLSPVVIEEFRTANDRNLPIFLFVKQADPRVPSSPEIREFLSTAARPHDDPLGEVGYVYATFAEGELGNLVYKALSQAIPSFDFWDRGRIPERYVASRTLKQRLKRIDHVFAPPQAISQARRILDEKRLLLLAGPPHLGKTALAQYLAIQLLKDGRVRRVLNFPVEGSLSELPDHAGSVILFDDPFGGVEFNVTSAGFGDGFQQLRSLTARNFAIVTTRKVVLDEAKRRTRLGEVVDLDSLTVNLSPSDYSESDLCHALTNLMDFHKPPQKWRSQIEQNMSSIVKALGFPHNLDVLITQMLPTAEDDDTLDSLVHAAAQIEEVIYNWFRGLYEKDPEQFFFLYLLAFFPGVDRTYFIELHQAFVSEIRASRGIVIPMPKDRDLERLTHNAASRVWLDENIGFEHPSYQEGILAAVGREFAGDVDAIIECAAYFVGWPEGSPEHTYATSALLSAAKMHPEIVCSRLSAWVETGLGFDTAQSVFTDLACADEDELVLETLASLWSSPDPDVRRFVEKTFGQVSVCAPAVLSLIDDKLRETDSRLRYSAVSCLAHALARGTHAALPILLEMTNDVDWFVRKLSAQALRFTSADDWSHVEPRLTELLHDANWMVANAAHFALSWHERESI